MVINNQAELDVLLTGPKKSLPKRILITFNFPDFGGIKLYIISSEGQNGEYKLV